MVCASNPTKMTLGVVVTNLTTFNDKPAPHLPVLSFHGTVLTILVAAAARVFLSAVGTVSVKMLRQTVLIFNNVAATLIINFIMRPPEVWMLRSW